VWLVVLWLKDDFEVTEELMEVMRQRDGIARAIDVAALDQMNHSIVKHVQDGKRCPLRVVLQRSIGQ